MRSKRNLSREEGFTLVEMMVVVLVLAILLTIALVSFSFSLRASSNSACKANLKILRDTVNRYYVDNGNFPATLRDLIPNYIESENGMSCPQSGEAYDYDPGTGTVSCPYHTDY